MTSRPALARAARPWEGGGVTWRGAAAARAARGGLRRWRRAPSRPLPRFIAPSPVPGLGLTSRGRRLEGARGWRRGRWPVCQRPRGALTEPGPRASIGGERRSGGRCAPPRALRGVGTGGRWGQRGPLCCQGDGLGLGQPPREPGRRSQPKRPRSLSKSPAPRPRGGGEMERLGWMVSGGPFQPQPSCENRTSRFGPALSGIKPDCLGVPGWSARLGRPGAVPWRSSGQTHSKPSWYGNCSLGTSSFGNAQLALLRPLSHVVKGNRTVTRR